MTRPPALPIKATRDTQVGIRITAALKAAAEQAAANDRRSLSQWIEGLMIDALAAQSSRRAPKVIRRKANIQPGE